MLERAIEAQIASLENHLKRLERPNPALERHAKDGLRDRYLDLLADARAAQQDFRKTADSLASVRSLEDDDCKPTNGELP